MKLEVNGSDSWEGKKDAKWRRARTAYTRIYKHDQLVHGAFDLYGMNLLKKPGVFFFFFFCQRGVLTWLALGSKKLKAILGESGAIAGLTFASCQQGEPADK